MKGIDGSYTLIFFLSSILHDGITDWRTRLEFIATEYLFNFGTHLDLFFFTKGLQSFFFTSA